jgi:serine/threonine protein kinase
MSGPPRHPGFTPDLLALAQLFPSYIRELPDFIRKENVEEGHGFVWRWAVDQATRKGVIIQEFADPISVKGFARFQRALYALAISNFPHIPPLVGFTVSRPYAIIFEDPGAMTLAAYIRTRIVGRPPSGSSLTKLVMALAATLAHVHANNIMFRNLSPYSIMVDDRACPYLIDFSDCLPICDATRPPYDKEVGPAQFWPPEMILSDKYTNKVDVYSFGLIVWCISEHDVKPHGGLAGTALMAAIVRDRSRPPLDRSPGPVRSLMKACWQDDADKRPKFKDILESMIKGDYWFRDTDSKSIKSLTEYLRAAEEKAQSVREPPKPASDATQAIKVLRKKSLRSAAKPEIEPEPAGAPKAPVGFAPSPGGPHAVDLPSDMKPHLFAPWYRGLATRLVLDSPSCGPAVNAIHKLINNDPQYLGTLVQEGFFSLPALQAPPFAKFALSFLSHLYCHRPEAVTGAVTPLLKFVATDSREKVCVLLGFFLLNFGEHADAIDALLVTFAVTDELVTAPSARKLLLGGCAVVQKFPKIRADHPKEVANFFTAFLKSERSDVLRSAYNVILTLKPDAYFELPFEQLIRQLAYLDFQRPAVLVMLQAREIPATDLMFGALLPIAEGSRLGFLALCKLADASEAACELFLKYPAWQLRPIPTFKETYQLLMLACKYPGFRVAISHTAEFGQLLVQVLATQDAQLAASISSLVKRCQIDAQSFAGLYTSRFLESYVAVGVATPDPEVACAVLVTISYLAGIGFSDVYLAFIPKMVVLLGQQDNLTVIAIKVFVQLSAFAAAGAALREAQMDGYFTSLAAVAGFEAYAQEFLANLANPRL